MRSRFLLMIVIASVAMTVGCAGKAARQRVTLPATVQVSPRVFDDVELGIADALETGDITTEQASEMRGQVSVIRQAMAGGRRAEIVAAANPVIWGQLSAMGERGIFRMAVTEGWEDSPDDPDDIPEPAESLLLRLQTFEYALRVLAEKL